jgi:hypothetical protein
MGNGLNTRLLRMRSWVRFTVQTFLCMNMSVCVGSGRFLCIVCIYFLDGRFGVVVGILAYYARGRECDSRTVQTFVCMNMSVRNGSGRFLCIVCTKKKGM